MPASFIVTYLFVCKSSKIRQRHLSLLEGSCTFAKAKRLPCRGSRTTRCMGLKRKKGADASARATRQTASHSGPIDSDLNKLKKRRTSLGLVKGEKAPNLKVLSAEEKAKKLDDRLLQIESNIDLFLKQSSENGFSVLPSVDLILTIEGILKELSVPVAITRLKKLPHALLIAARKGCDEHRRELGSGTRALVRTLTSMAAGACISVPEEGNNIRELRSVFHRNGKNGPTRAELEATKRAGKWALEVLTSCVRGEGENSGDDGGDSQVYLQHGDTSRVFVAPRDSLDKCMAEHYISIVVGRIERLWRNRNMPFIECVSALLLICEDLLPVIGDPFFLPIVEAVLICSSKIQVPLLCVDEKQVGQDGAIPDFFRKLIIATEGTDIMFHQLSQNARRALLQVSDQAWSLHMQAVEHQFNQGCILSVVAERKAVVDLAHVAAEDVCRHWDLMDQLRVEVSGMKEPFSTQLWRKRRFYRAVLGETVDIVCQAQHAAVSEKESTRVVSLNKRLPPQYRHSVQAAALLTITTMWTKENGRGNAAAGPKALDVLFQDLKLDESSNISPNVHAMLLCVERLLERLCWASAHAIADKERVQELHISERRVRGMLCKLSCVLEMVRLPGGVWAESEEAVRQRSGAMDSFLELIILQRQIPTKKYGEWKMGGLFATAVCGILCGTKVTGVDRLRDSLEHEERVEVQHALEISREMVRESVDADKVEALYQDVMGEARTLDSIVS